MTHYLQQELYDRIEPTLFDFLEQGSIDGIWYWDLTQKQNMWISPHFWNLLGYRQDEMEHLTKEWKRVAFEEDLQNAMAKLGKHLKTPSFPFNQVIRYQHKSGATVWLRCRAMAIRNEEEQPIRIIAFHNDVTHTMQKKDDLKQYQEEIEHLRQEIQKQAFHDSLTKIYNYRGLEENYKYLIEVAKRDGSFLSAAMFEIDYFSELAVRHGQERVDKVLKEMASMLLDSTRRVDILGRFDDERFIVLMPNTAPSDAIMVSERIRSSIEKNGLGGVDYLSVSCGVASVTLTLSDDTQKNYDALNLWMDEALYHAKKSGCNCVLHYKDIDHITQHIEAQEHKEKYQKSEDFYR